MRGGNTQGRHLVCYGIWKCFEEDFQTFKNSVNAIPKGVLKERGHFEASGSHTIFSHESHSTSKYPDLEIASNLKLG